MKSERDKILTGEASINQWGEKLPLLSPQIKDIYFKEEYAYQMVEIYKIYSTDSQSITPDNLSIIQELVIIGQVRRQLWLSIIV